MTYHLGVIGWTPRRPLCDQTLAPGDVVVPRAEASDPGGRHFNCVDCHKVLTDGQRHVPEPDRLTETLRDEGP